MDRAFFWLPGWRLRPRPEIRKLLAETVEADRWIIDGTSPGTLDIRLPRADVVLFYRPGRTACLVGVGKRWLRYRGRSRPELPEGCPEKIDMPFLRYIWRFERTETPEIMEMIEIHGPEVPVIMLKSRRQAAALLADVARIV
jgi:adenylate kinase family enzyme